MLILSVLWVFILLGLFHWSSPDQQYPKEFDQRASYDCIWLGTVGLLIYLHYSLMAKGGYGELAIVLDLLAAGLFFLLGYVRNYFFNHGKKLGKEVRHGMGRALSNFTLRLFRHQRGIHARLR